MLPIISLGSLHIPTYLLIISLTYCFCLIWVVRRAEQSKIEIKRFDHHTTLDIALAIMIGGFLGARLLHVIYEAPDYYLEAPLRIFKIWQGGFVFYGGALGAGLAFYILSIKRNLEIPKWLDLYAPIFPLGYAIGRLSCLAAGCCYGKPTDLFWGIIFPVGVEAPAGITLHPTQLYAFVWEIILFGTLILLEKRKTSIFPGGLFTLWLIGHSLGRLLMEVFRDDHRGPSLNLSFLDLSISSSISFLILIVASFVFIRSYKKTKKQG